MVKNENLNQILALIKKFTDDFIVNNASILNSYEIAEHLNLTRSSVSRYLNTLYNDKKLIKIHTRPVLFFDAKTLERKTNIKVEEFDFLSMKEMFAYLKMSETYDFEDLIGYKETLFETIKSLKSEINYPGNRMLTIHFQGNRGTGKKKLIKSLMHYCRQNGIVDTEQNLYVYQCSNKQENIKEILFGKEGVLAKNKRGMLYLERVELMAIEVQEMLASYLSSMKERKMNMKRIIVFSTEAEGMIERLKNKMVASYIIPDLKDRAIIEQNSFVLMFLRGEAEKFQKEIKISSYAFQAFSAIHFRNNIDDLKHTIIRVLANCNMDGRDEIVIKTYNLVEMVSDYSSFFASERENVMLSLDEIERQLEQDDLLDKYDQFLNLYETLRQGKLLKEEYLAEASLLLNNILDYLILNMNIDNEKIKGLSKIISNICDLVKSRSDIYIYNDMVMMLSKIIYKLAYLDSNIQDWSNRYDDTLQEIKSLYMDTYHEAAMIAQWIERLVKQFIEIQLDSVTFINIIMIIAEENEVIEKDCYALIVAHGYATASSIANTTNKLLGKHVFDAINMPFDVSTADIVSKIDNYIADSAFIRNLILLVDMGSLEETSSMIKRSEGMKIGVVNNVSTRIALEIGEGIIFNREIEDIVRTACQRSFPSYKMLKHKVKEKVILFTSEAGEAISNRMIQLFKMSLPKKIEAKIMSYDYAELLKNGDQNLVFEDYEIILMIGVSRKMFHCPSIAFEELLTVDSITVLNSIFKGLSFDDKEVKEFNDNLLKYFSLENVMNIITILNANILIDLIEDALRKLQKSLTFKLNPKVMYGLYIHLSSLIERLVLKSSGNVYSDISKFETMHQEFISSVKNSFKKLSNYYNVEIPLSEIAYLYDYIMKWM